MKAFYFWVLEINWYLINKKRSFKMFGIQTSNSQFRIDGLYSMFNEILLDDSVIWL